MADSTIHGLTQILKAAVVAANDELALWDADAATTKRLAVDNIPIGATQIADGSVTNTEFQYINSLTANAQDQLDTHDTDLYSGDDPGHGHSNDYLTDFAYGQTSEIKGGLNSPGVRWGETQNLLTYSEMFNDATWVKTAITGGAITADGAIAPNGSTRAENFSGTDATGAVSQTKADANTGNYTFSVWLKMQSGTGSVDIILYDDATPPATDTVACSLTTTWQRFSVTTNHANAPTNKIAKILCGTSAIAAWGAQLQPGALAGPYKYTQDIAAPALYYVDIQAHTIDIGKASFTTLKTYKVEGEYWNTYPLRIGTLISARAAGTAYSLTATPALLNFGTTDPTINLSGYGTYELSGWVRLDYNGATFAAPQTVTIKIRDTSTSSDKVSIQVKTEIITTGTKTMMVLHLPKVDFWGNVDTIQLWGDVDVVPSAGSLDAVDGEIRARLIS